MGIRANIGFVRPPLISLELFCYVVNATSPYLENYFFKQILIILICYLNSFLVKFFSDYIEHNTH